MALNSDPDLLPIEWSREVIKQMTETSAVMGLSKRVQMSTRQQRIPATAVLADSYWVGTSANDFTNLKQEASAQWKGVDLVTEELACLVAIPDAYEADNAFPVWDEVRPQIVEAMGRRLDAAALFGTGAPASWQTAIVPSAIAAGQTLPDSTGTDIAQTVALSAQQLKERGFATTGWAVEPGFQWLLTGLRSTDGIPIYQQDLAGDIRTGLYGRPLVEVANGAWDETAAVVVHGDWSKSIVGIRQDITFSRHDSGIISDSSGNVVYNAMQQDSVIWRAVFRVAWARANPATRLGPNADQSGDLTPGTEAAPVKFPWSVITPSGS